MIPHLGNLEKKVKNTFFRNSKANKNSPETLLKKLQSLCSGGRLPVRGFPSAAPDYFTAKYFLKNVSSLSNGITSIL